MRLPNSILTAQLLSHLAPVLIVTMVLASFVFNTARDSLESEVGRTLRDIARIAARDVPVERLVLIREGAEETRMVRRLTAKLDSVRRLAGVAAVGVCGVNGALLLDTTDDRRIGARCPRSHPGHAPGAQGGRDGQHRRRQSRRALHDGTLFAVLAVRAGAGALDVAEEMQVRLLRAAGLTAIRRRTLRGRMEWGRAME